MLKRRPFSERLFKSPLTFWTHFRILYFRGMPFVDSFKAAFNLTVLVLSK